MRVEAARANRGIQIAGCTLDRAHVRALAIEAGALAGLTAATAAVYVWTKAPLYNQFGTIDPWLYTALWTNFDQIYEAFPRTYYISRIPWIVPGYALNGIFDARTAFLVLHSAFFVAGGFFFYLLCRRWLGVAAAAMGFVGLIGSQMYFNAHRWDYQEGGVITYMLGAYAFSLPRTQSPFLRACSLGLGGAFAAAMVTTRVSDAPLLVGIPLLFLAVTAEAPIAARLKQFGRDVAGFAVGAAALLVACGLFAKSHGEEFLFFMPQVRVVQSTTGGYNQIPVDIWLRYSPHFWVPVFAVLFGMIVFAAGPRRDRLARRVLMAATLWLAVDYAAFAAWQFLGDGWILNYTFYFSSFLVPTLLCLTAAAAVVIGRVPTRRSILVGITSAVAVLAPIVWIYRTDSPLRIGGTYGDDAYLAMFLLMGVAILLAILAAVPRLRAIGAGAVVAAFLAAAYGVDASYATYQSGASDPRTGGLYDVGQKLIGNLRANGYDKALPRLWYDGSDVASGIGSIQSLYYYAFTYLDTRMPATDETFRFRMTMWRPKRIVLLCAEPRCKGAEQALERAGYKPSLQSDALLVSEGVRVWVKIYRVEVTA
jgi:hypothetical protein